jgi:hypothetical protein
VASFHLFNYRIITPIVVVLILLSLSFFTGFGKSLIDEIYNQLHPPSNIETALETFNNTGMIIDRTRSNSNVQKVDKNYPFFRLKNRNTLLFIIESYGIPHIPNTNTLINWSFFSRKGISSCNPRDITFSLII